MLEVSCGIILFEYKNNEPYFLLIKDYNGNYGFPKGHIEKGESELVTAFRETLEETSIIPKIIDGFRAETTYKMPNGNQKRVVYFLGNFENQIPKQNEGFEKFDFLILPYQKAYEILSFENTKQLLLKANSFIKNNAFKNLK